MWKIAKGTMDLVGNDYAVTKKLITDIESEFIRNGGEPLDTPVFERTDVLLGKYGEEADSKLIYRIEENGGEPLALRYDMTLPFVRYIKENKIKKMRRYSIGKVYRRDQPTIKQGRFREFYQADFDIVGEKQDGMLAEGMLLKMACNIMKEYNIKYKVLINDVCNIQTMIQKELGYTGENWRNLCPIIDKLDKKQFDDLIPEFLSVDSSVDIEKLRQLLATPQPFNSDTAIAWEQLQDYADIFDFKDCLEFSNSLARGLDYYTGFIWELKVTGENNNASIIAGGRYDNLLDLPTVGISFGVSRIVSMLSIPPPTKTGCRRVFVTSIGNVTIKQKLQVVAQISKNPNLIVTYSLSQNQKKLSKVLGSDIDECVIVAENELKEGYVMVKDLASGIQTKLNVVA